MHDQLAFAASRDGARATKAARPPARVYDQRSFAGGSSVSRAAYDIDATSDLRATGDSRSPECRKLSVGRRGRVRAGH
ncbi:hypothetical protein Dimus_026835, partial [Dionaea muscipula]